MNLKRMKYNCKFISLIPKKNFIFKNIEILGETKHFYKINSEKLILNNLKNYDLNYFLEKKDFKNLKISNEIKNELNEILFCINNYNEYFSLDSIVKLIKNNIKTNFVKRLRLLNNFKSQTSLFGNILRLGITNGYNKFLKQYFKVNNPAKNHNGALSPFSKNFLKYSNLNTFEIKNEIKKVKEKTKETKINHPENNSTKIEYYLNKGFDLETSKKLLSERQSTFSLEKCLKKFGEIEGLNIFKNRQEKWQNTLNSKTDFEKLQIRKLKGTGFLNKLFLKDKIVKKENGILYFCKFYNSEINFYKIGITSKTISDRFDRICKFCNLKYDILIEYNDTFYNCYKLEQKILKTFKNYSEHIEYKNFTTFEAFNRNLTNEIKQFFIKIY